VGCTYLQRNKYNMTISIIEQFVRVFAPHLCVGCGVEEDRLLCRACAEKLPLAPSHCYRCKVTTESYAVCRSCAPHTQLNRVVVGTPYQGVARALVHRMKYERARAGVGEIATWLAPLMAHFSERMVLVPVPTATSRIRARGYDHARLLTRVLAHRTSLPYRLLLARSGQAHQVGASRAGRLNQLQGTFRPVHTEQIKGRHVVLVDDVLTTGASLETAARTLRRAGAASVSAIVFAEA